MVLQAPGEEGNPLLQKMLHAPMDCSDVGDLVRSDQEDESTPLGSVDLSTSMEPDDAPLHGASLEGRDGLNHPQHPNAIEGGHFTGMCVLAAGSIRGESQVEEEEQGVTAEADDGTPGQLGLPKLKLRFTQMVIGVRGGPLPSGDGKAVEELNLQDLRDINSTVLSLKVASNPKVKEACGMLDEREARGFLTADVLGIELLPGQVAPTEGHKLGKQVEELLSDAKVTDERLRGAAKQRRNKARSKLQAEALEKKLAASDDKFKTDRTALWSTAVHLNLPAGVVEVKREQPVKAVLPKPPPPSASMLRTTIEKAEAAAARAEADVIAARRRSERADAAVKVSQAQRLATATGGYLLDDEAYAKLKALQAEQDAKWQQLTGRAGQLRRELSDAEDAELQARFDVEEAREELAATQAAAAREAEWAAAREADKAARAAEAEQLRRERHRELMAFYDTLTPEQLEMHVRVRGRILNEKLFKDSPLRQPLAPGAPRVYDLRGDSSTWELPSPPPSPPEDPLNPPPQSSSPPPAQAPLSPPTPPTRPPRCPVCRALRNTGSPPGCVNGGVCTQIIEDEDESSEAPISPVHPTQPL